MSVFALLLLAVVAMAGLATLRFARVQVGRAPFPEGRGKTALIIAFFIVPPLALAAVAVPVATASPVGVAVLLLVYVAVLAALASLMGIGAMVARAVARGRLQRVLWLVLMGSEIDPDDMAFDPPVTAELALSMAAVDGRNALFPRGGEFPGQVNRTGFRDDWDALDVATGTLERRIADDHRLGLPVAAAAAATATDARGRLNTLRRRAVGQGQVWATG
jgi:hypothetical protein